jgi:N-acetylglucosaminyldiphosphoundecaprenol N-acetyl-beta-D-mannosaminyltransferase
MKVFNILGVKINITNLQDTTNYIIENIMDIKGQYICVSNVHTTVTAHECEAYKLIQNESFMSLPDGGPLSILAKIKGNQECKRVTGPDLMESIFELSEEKGFTHFFYGSTEDTLEKLNQKLKSKFPKIKINGMYSPPFRPLTILENEQIIKLINESNSDFLWIGLGAPKQELWMYEHRGKINSIMIGVGAGFDYHADNIKRAPTWMQHLSLEWLYRLGQDPKRLWKRYLVYNTKFIFYVFKEFLRRNKHESNQRR